MITLSGSGNVLSLTLDTGAPVAGIDPPGAILSAFDLSTVQQIDIETGLGADTITIGSGVPNTRIFGGIGAGSDTLIINGATGNNTLTSSSFIGNTHNITAINGIEDLTINGTSGNENVFATSLPAHGNIHFNLGNGANNVFLGAGNLINDIGTVTSFSYTGGTGGDGISVNNQFENTRNWVNEVFGAFTDFIAAGYYLNIGYSSVEAVTIHGSAMNDQSIVASGSPNAIVLNGNEGADSFNVGGGNLLSAAGLATMDGGPGLDTLILNDSLSTGNLPWTINGDLAPVPRRIFLGVNEFTYTGFEGVGILGGTVGQEFRFNGNIDISLDIDGGGGGDTIIVGHQVQTRFLAPATIRGGSGNDNFQWTRASTNWAQGSVDIFLYDVLLDGGIGFNTLAIDETTRAAAGYLLYPDRFYATDGAAFPVGFDLDYDNMQAISLTAGGGTTNVGVYGTSSDIDPTNQISIALGSGNDNVYLYPHDAQGNLTINGNLGIGGGANTDNLFVDDSASPVPANYGFANTFGAGTQNITGLGAAGFGIGSDFEGITMTGSVYNDVYNVNSYKSGMGMTINGGLGDDTCNFGNNDLAANVTSIASFLFDGMGDTDTFNLRNATPSNSFTYTAANNTTLQASRSLPSAYNITLAYFNTEQKAVYAGSAADTFNITSFASGEMSFHGAGGDDTMNFPTSSDLIGRRVNFFGDGGTLNRIVQTTNTKSVGTILHVSQNSIGAFPGDTFFAPGGSVYFDLVQSIQLRGSDSADNVYMQPNAVAAISIAGGNPPAAPGDVLNLALANAVSPNVTGTAANGSVTSSNLKTLGYSGFETGPNIDAIAPQVVSADIDVDGPDAGAIASSPPDAAPPVGVSAPYLEIEFSENVALLLGTAAIQLTRLAPDEIVPQSYLAMAYDSASRTAYFTFPGYPSGILPDGNYHGEALAGGTADVFGNSLAANAPFDFFSLTADANHDRHVDTLDFSALAMNFNKTSSVTFRDGDFNYDGRVNALDFGALATRFGVYLAPPASAFPAAGRALPTQPTQTLFAEAVIRPSDERLEIFA